MREKFYRLNYSLMIFLVVFLTISNVSSEELKVIAFVQDTMANDFRKAQVFEVRNEVAKHSNLKFLSSDAKGQTSLLIRQLERFILMKVDLIILGTNDAQAVVPVVAKAYKAGIPVIILDRGINGSDYTTFISSDNLKIGTIAADYIAEKLQKKGTVLLFEGLQKADVTQLRSKGFLDEIAQYKDIKVIKRTGNFLRKDAIIEMEKLLKEGVHIDAIFSESDSMLSGVRSVFNRYKIDPASIITVGCDYITEARDNIRKGKQTASILFPLGGKQAIEVALKTFAHQQIPKHISIPIKLITQDNVEEVSPIF